MRLAELLLVVYFFPSNSQIQVQFWSVELFSRFDEPCLIYLVQKRLSRISLIVKFHHSRDVHGFDTESFTITETFSSSVLVVHDLHETNQKQNRQTNTNRTSETFQEPQNQITEINETCFQ